jgi:hypothetical protein
LAAFAKPSAPQATYTCAEQPTSLIPKHPYFSAVLVPAGDADHPHKRPRGRSCDRWPRGR